MEIENEKFLSERDASKKILEEIRREIDTERARLIDIKKESNFYRRRVRYLEKKLDELQTCLPIEEN